jgi:hypothetical protein
MEHEWIGVPAKLSDYEWHTLSHQAGNEGNVARKSVQLRHDYAALRALGRCQCRRKLGPAIERIGALASFNLDIFADDRKALGLGKPRNSCAFGLRSAGR